MKPHTIPQFVTVVFALAVLMFVSPAPQSARTAGPWYVAPGGNDGNTCASPAAPCATINGAIGKATSGDTILVATGVYTGTGDQVVLLDKSANLSGGWNSAFTTQADTAIVDGQQSRRGITIKSDTIVTIERFTVLGGLADWPGGGISNGGTLTLSHSTVSGNSAGYVGGGVSNAGTLYLNNSVVSNNNSSEFGGGISNNGALILNNSTISDNTGNQGGGIHNQGTLTLNNSIVRYNSAAAHGGGINIAGGDLTLNGSSVSGNTGKRGGGIRGYGGAVTLNNSTVTRNAAYISGAGIYNHDNALALNNSTISENTASNYGGGIENVSPGSVTLQNSIVAGNSGSTNPDCYTDAGTLSSAGYNLIGNTSGCSITLSTGDLTNTNAYLGQLIVATGTSKYHPLLPGSPAIDAGNPGGCTGSTGLLNTDQRGASRVGRCDIGAYEYTTPGLVAQVAAVDGTPQHVPPLGTLHTPLRAAALDSIGSPVSNTIVTFSAPASGASGTFANTGAFTTTNTTNESGLTTAASFTANGVVGSYLVTATASGVVTPATFLLRNIGWYVSSGGNNSNDCLGPAMACATINAALNKPGFVAGDTIVVATGTYTGTGNEVVLLNKSATLSGGWNNDFAHPNSTSTIDGQDSRRGITVNEGMTAVIERFTVQSGFAIYDGGGIYNSGILTLTNSVVRDSTTSYSGPGNGGGIYNASGSMALNNSTVSGNTSNYGKGGGIHNVAYMTLNNSHVISNTANMNYDYAGSGIYNAGVMLLNNSTVSGNTITSLSWGGAGILNQGTLTINNSSINGNSSNSRGGGICNNTGTVALNNSTVSSNSGASGGGIYSNGTLTLSSSTVSNNNGEGIFNEGGSANLRNSIVAQNISLDCWGTVSSTGYNLVGSTNACNFISTTGDLVNIGPGLFPLTGTPAYHPLSRYSPAVDAGNPAGCTDENGRPLDTDQRGSHRVGRCDIGAFEYDPSNDPLAYISLPIVLRQLVCNPLYSDDFGNPASGWPTADNSNAAYGYLNGEYRIVEKRTYKSAGARPGFKASDLVAVVDVRNAAGVTGYYGIMFGIADDWSQSYFFWISSFGYYGVSRYNSSSGWLNLLNGPSSYINTGAATNRIKVERNGSQIKGYVNGHLVADLTDSTYTGERHVGLGVMSSSSPNAEARFDNLAIYPSGCGAMTDYTDTSVAVMATNQSGDWGGNQQHILLRSDHEFIHKPPITHRWSRLH